MYLLFYLFYTDNDYQNNTLPSNEILLRRVLIPKLLNNPFASCSFINLDFLLPHIAHFDDDIDLPFLVFNTFELTYSVFFLHFKKYVNMFYNDQHKKSLGLIIFQTLYCLTFILKILIYQTYN